MRGDRPTHNPGPNLEQDARRVRRPVLRSLQAALVALLAITMLSGSAPLPAVASAQSAGFSGWLDRVKTRARSEGISAATVKAAFEGVTLDERILELLEDQPEYTRAFWQYLEFAVSDARVAKGRKMLVEHRKILNAIEAIYGVDRHIVVAIWGLETTYGANFGSKGVIRSLATLAYKGGRREDFWLSQLFAALKILERGDIAPERFVGSWAGAMGHTQFIPTTYNAYAVDFDGDRKRDIWNSIADALGSAANYLKESGWQSGERWGYEVRVPEGFDYALAGDSTRKPVAAWQELGFRRADGEAFRDHGQEAGLILPMGAKGPGFLIFPNFRVILRYNRSTHYALSIGHMADRFQGGGAFIQDWPRDEKPLARAERKELQQLLVERGYSTGGIDGIIGSQTRAAVRSFQKAEGLPADGFASSGILQRLRVTTDDRS